MGFFLPMLGMAAAGAAGGMASKFGMSKEKKMEPLMTPEQKAQASASQALIPGYLKLMAGQMPEYLRQYLMQTQGALQQQFRTGVSDYLRQIGAMGMDFGPQQAAQLGQMYQGMIPALTNALMQAKMQAQGKAQEGLQQWSTQSYPWAQPPNKQPSAGMSALSGGLSGFSSFLGNKVIPGAGTAGAAGGVKYPTTAQANMANPTPQAPKMASINPQDLYQYSRLGAAGGY